MFSWPSASAKDETSVEATQPAAVAHSLQQPMSEQQPVVAQPLEQEVKQQPNSSPLVSAVEDEAGVLAHSTVPKDELYESLNASATLGTPIWLENDDVKVSAESFEASAGGVSVASVAGVSVASMVDGSAASIVDGSVASIVDGSAATAGKSPESSRKCPDLARLPRAQEPTANATPIVDCDAKNKSAIRETAVHKGRQAFTNCITEHRRLNIMVAGQSGSGKTTLLRTLVHGLCVHYDKIDQWENFLKEQGSEVKKTTSIQPQEIARLEFPWPDNKTLLITIVDTKGYGDDLDETESYKPIQQYIYDKFSAWRELIETSASPTTKLDDERVHCLLYFLNNSRFRKNDHVHMKHLEDYAPIIPIIPKADCLAIDEINNFLLRGKFTTDQIKRITAKGPEAVLRSTETGRADELSPGPLSQSAAVPTGDNDGDDGVVHSLTSAQIKIFRSSPAVQPFHIEFEGGELGFKVVVQDVYAIIARDQFKQDGTPLNRRYPWGEASILEPYHSDFARLERMLFRNRNRGLVRLVDETDILWKTWRAARIAEEKQRIAEEKQKSPEARAYMMWIVLWSVVICCGFVGLLIFFLSSGPVIDASFLQDLLPRPTLLSISQCTVMISVFLAGSFARPKIQPLLDTAQTLFVEQTKKWQRQR